MIIKRGMSKNTLPLPVELVVLVLENLPPQDILGCRLISKLFDQVIANTTGIQYRLDLFSAGMEDDPSVKLSKAEKHRILNRYQKAWRSFSPDTAHVQDIPLLDGPLWELSGGVLAQSVGRKILQFKQLPGIVRGVKARDWTLEIDFTVDDFTFDPSQELLLAIEGTHNNCYVRPLNLSTGERHPLAKEDRLECPTPALTFHDRVYIIRACGDLFGLIVRESHVVGEQSDDRLVVRNWKTGDILLSLVGRDYLSLSFLDETHVMLSRSIFEPGPGTTNGTIQIFDLSHGDPEDMSSFTNLTFGLPRTARSWSYWNVEVVCDPAPIRSFGGVSEAPFHLAPENRIVVVRARAAQMVLGGASDFDFFVSSKTLLAYFELLSPGEGGCLSWDQWGPRNTRILPSISKQMWCYPAHGNRAVGVSGNRLVIHEFHPYTLRKITALNDDPEHVQVVRHASTLRTSGMFSRMIDHHLPYARINTSIHATSKMGIMISEDSVVLVCEEAKNFRVYSI